MRVGANARAAMEAAKPRRLRMDPGDRSVLTARQAKELQEVIVEDVPRLIAIDLLVLANRFRRYGQVLGEGVEFLARLLGRPLEQLEACSALVLPVVRKLADDHRLLHDQYAAAGRKGAHGKWANEYHRQAKAPTLSPAQRREIERKLAATIEGQHEAAWAKHEIDCDRRKLWEKPAPKPPDAPAERPRFSASKWVSERAAGMLTSLGNPALSGKLDPVVANKLAEMTLRLGGGQGGVEYRDIQAALYLSPEHFMGEWVPLRWGDPAGG